MKRLLCMLLTSCIVSISFSQVRFGLKAGINIANEHIKLTAFGRDFDRSGDAIISFQASGGIVEIPISRQFAFRPELLLSGKGSDLPGEDDNGNTYTVKVRPYYLEVPLNVVYRHQFPSKLTFYGGAGPYLAYGLFGKAERQNEKVDVFDDDGGYKRFDFGINVLAGLELASGITFSINWSPGLANIASTDNIEIMPGVGVSDIKFRNSSFGLSIGYMFRK